MLDVRKVNYAGHPVVKVRIISVKPSLLVVRMEDGNKGIVPRKEWKWDRREKPDTSKWLEGTSHEAVLLADAAQTGAYAALSFKELNDPWEGITLKIGQIIRGEVVNILRDAIFVQLKPGVDAVNWAADLPLLQEELPINVLSIGDQVYAKITELDLETRKVGLSINDWLRDINLNSDHKKDRVIRIFEKKLEELNSSNTQSKPYELESQEAEFYVTPLKKLFHVLIIDNNKEDQINIITSLAPLNIKIDIVNSGREAFEWLKAHEAPDLFIMDINLGEGAFGPEVAEQILTLYGDEHRFLFISRDPHNLIAFRSLEEKQGTKFPFYTKQTDAPTDTLIRIISLFQAGIIHKTKGIVARNQELFVEQLEMQAFLNAPLVTSLEEMMGDFRRTTFVQHAFILELDEEQRLFKLIAASPNHRLEVYEYGLDNLYYSQARQVIEDEDILYGSLISAEEKQGKFRNFFSHIPFHSCYAIPIKMHGYTTKHGLFILNNTPDLTWDTILHIRTMANHCAVLLERDNMLRKLQMYEDRYFKGQLFGTLMHEMGNFLEGLKNNVQNTEFFGLTKPNQANLEKSIKGLQQSVRDIESLNNSYTRMMKDDLDFIEINEIVEKVKRQLSYKAKEENNVEIVLDLDTNMPKVKANSLRVEQIISNVVLNSIQHVAIHHRKINNINNIKGYSERLLTDRLVLVQTYYCENADMCRIGVLDTGPGVPYDQHHKIFKAGESSRRDGQGLGLFISKNLAEAMQGELILADTVRFAGSAFVVSFPATPSL